MNVLLTVCSGIAFVCCVWVFIRTQSLADESLESARAAESTAMKLRAERDRVTVAERELDALRRELRKLSGKFYSAMRELDAVEEIVTPPFDPKPQTGFPVCDNWLDAQTQGPSSEAAKCTCPYCEFRRGERLRQRDELVPKTVQGQAALARVNAGKP